MKIAIVTGPENITAQDERLVRAVCHELIRRGFMLYVGDAEGVDFIIAREALDFNRKIFWTPPEFGNTPAGIAERGARMINAALCAGVEEVICVGFVNIDCPAEIAPGRNWQSGKTEQNATWSTLALCVGHEIETWIFPLGEFSRKFLYTWPISWRTDYFGAYHAWHSAPASVPLSQQDLADGWTKYVRDEDNPL